jgi:hypothetical protein
MRGVSAGMRRFGFTAAALVAGIASAHAQGPDQRLARYVASHEYADAVMGRAEEADRLRKTGCDQPKALRHALFQVLDPPRFAEGSDVPIAGVWMDRVDIDRCGAAVAENILVVAEEGAVKFVRLLPGTTRASPLLQHDAMQPAISAAVVKKDNAEKAGAKPCPDQEGTTVSDTRFVRERVPIVNDPSGRMTAGAWDETWTFLFCGREVPVQIYFDADGSGGTNFTVKPSE